MSKNTDYIHQLMTEKLAGIISAMDEAYLDGLIDTDVGIRKTWMRMQATIFGNKNAALKAVQGKLKRNRLLVAAIFSGVLFASSYFVWYLMHSSEKAINRWELLQNPPIVKLRLSNGQTVNLSTALDTVRIGNTKLAAANNTLIFPVGTALPSGINTIIVPVGQTYQVVLPDGSLVWLNSATQLQFPTFFDSSVRKVVIRGEAYLEVAKNTAKSFMVDAGSSSIQVLGTAFNVNNYDQQKVTVSLVKGSVKIKTTAEVKQLQPGEQAITIPDHPISVQEFDTERELAWRNGVYYFTDASLEEICQVIPRWFSNQVKMDNATVGKQRFTGRLQKKMPIAQFLETLKATSFIQYDTTKDGTIHFK